MGDANERRRVLAVYWTELTALLRRIPTDPPIPDDATCIGIDVNVLRQTAGFIFTHPLFPVHTPGAETWAVTRMPVDVLAANLRQQQAAEDAGRVWSLFTEIVAVAREHGDDSSGALSWRLELAEDGRGGLWRAAERKSTWDDLAEGIDQLTSYRNWLQVWAAAHR
jgi:hypothetical protein